MLVSTSLFGLKEFVALGYDDRLRRGEKECGEWDI